MPDLSLRRGRRTVLTIIALDLFLAGIFSVGPAESPLRAIASLVGAAATAWGLWQGSRFMQYLVALYLTSIGLAGVAVGMLLLWIPAAMLGGYLFVLGFNLAFSGDIRRFLAYQRGDLASAVAPGHAVVEITDIDDGDSPDLVSELSATTDASLPPANSRGRGDAGLQVAAIDDVRFADDAGTCVACGSELVSYHVYCSGCGRRVR